MKYVIYVFDVLSKWMKVGIVVEGWMFYVVVDLNRIVRELFLLVFMGMIFFLYGD